ncbi:hypothetical protein NDQ72_08930 [Halomonas sp. KG2]|uniref:hypothetical protein n=1 Tax=Halomonas sp. KG2 TaxID=2951138 RepID=UPI0026470817|nr:hypothetical protein [Halomonas sp. KG2]WKD30048.1 hypothetical protein NDQ72_08930 [Halomonas sp. KG2]
MVSLTKASLLSRTATDLTLSVALTTIDAENAADAAYAGVRTVTFKVKAVKESKEQGVTYLGWSS